MTMRPATRNFLAAALLLLLAGGCKPDDKLLGTWVNVKTDNRIEFNENHTGAIFQRTDPRLPPAIPFRWSRLDGHHFKVDVGAGGANGPTANGRIDGDTLILDNDTFRKAQ